jgi:hypothetical protein
MTPPGWTVTCCRRAATIPQLQRPRPAGRCKGPMLPLVQELVVVRVGADPVPDHRVAVANADGSPSEADADGVDRLRRVDLLEAQALVERVSEPQAVSVTGRLLDIGRELAASGSGDRPRAEEAAERLSRVRGHPRP